MGGVAAGLQRGSAPQRERPHSSDRAGPHLGALMPAPTRARIPARASGTRASSPAAAARRGCRAAGRGDEHEPDQAAAVAIPVTSAMTGSLGVKRVRREEIPEAGAVEHRAPPTARDAALTSDPDPGPAKDHPDEVRCRPTSAIPRQLAVLASNALGYGVRLTYTPASLLEASCSVSGTFL